MPNIRRVLSCSRVGALQVAFCATFIVSCAESTPTETRSAVAANTVADASVDAPDGTTVPAAEGCLEVLTRESGTASYTRKTWDAERRELTSESANEADFAGRLWTLKWHYGLEGQILAYLGVEQPFQHDYSYDEHGNTKDFRLTYPGAPSLDAPSAASVWIGTSYANEYDTSGRLVASVASAYGASSNEPTPPVRTVYAEDASGRCAHVERTLANGKEVEDREYDVAGRLTHSEVVGEGKKRVRVIDYDDKGRVVRSTETFSGEREFHAGSIVIEHDYLADGSERVDIENETSDVLGEQHSVQTRTAACLAIDAEVGSRPDARCRVQ